MRNLVGTMEWAAAGAGTLRNADRRRLVGQLLLTRLLGLPQQLRALIGIDSGALSRIDLAAIRVPDSPMALRATALLEATSPPWLVNHCMRTWLWGAMLGQASNLRFDQELFYTASVLHDLGLTGASACQDGCAVCFAVSGARAAGQFARQAGWSAERSEQLAEAIALHMNVRVGVREGAEAHLLHEGAALDVIGARMAEIDQATLQAVLARHPRMGFKDRFAAAMEEQGKRQPQSRAAFLNKLGFSTMIRKAAWPD